MPKRVLLPMLTAMAAIIAFAIAWSAGVWAFLDLPALALVPGVGTLYALLAHGGRAGLGAFSTAFDPGASESELRSADRFFESLGKSYLAFAFLGFLIGMISMFRNLENRMMLGPNLAFATVGLEYAAILHLLLVLPCRFALARLRDRLED